MPHTQVAGVAGALERNGRAMDNNGLSEQIGKYRWVICALLFFATTINYIDRQILSLLKPILDVELGWTNEQFGMINSVFQAAYGFGLLGFGWFVDKFGTKLGYTVSIVGWSLAAAAHALVSTVTGFGFARAALGISEGGNFPSAIKAVAMWFPKRERAFATSLFNSGTNVGAIIAPAIVPAIALHWGWQSAFIIAGFMGFMWLFLWIPFYEVPERCRRVKAAELALIRSDPKDMGGDSKVLWRSLFKYRQTWSFILGKFLTDPVWWFFLIWLPDFFKKTLLLDIKNSWVHLVTIYTIVTVLSIIGGWVTGYLTKGGWSVTKARKVGMFIFAVCVVPVVFATSFGRFNVNQAFFQKFASATYTVEQTVKDDKTGADKRIKVQVAVPAGLADELKPLDGKSFRSIEEFIRACGGVIYPERSKQLRQAFEGKSVQLPEDYLKVAAGIIPEKIALKIKKTLDDSEKAKKAKGALTVDEFVGMASFLAAEEIRQPLADCARDNFLFWFAVLIIGLAGAAHQAWSANLYTTVSDMFPKKAVASVIGLGGMAGSLGGMCFPIISGRLLDKFTAAGNVTAGYAILFTICGSAYLVAFAIHHALAPKFEPFVMDE